MLSYLIRTLLFFDLLEDFFHKDNPVDTLVDNYSYDKYDESDDFDDDFDDDFNDDFDDDIYGDIDEDFEEDFDDDVDTDLDLTICDCIEFEPF